MHNIICYSLIFFLTHLVKFNIISGQEVAVDVSAASIPVTFVTSQLCQPSNFRAVHVTSEKIQLKWDFPPRESDGSKALG